MTTIGFGDLYPTTFIAKMFTTTICFLGVAFWCLPAGIIGSVRFSFVIVFKLICSMAYLRVLRSKFKRRNVMMQLIVSFPLLQQSYVIGGAYDVLIMAIVLFQHGKSTLLFNVVYVQVPQ